LKGVYSMNSKAQKETKAKVELDLNTKLEKEFTVSKAFNIRPYKGAVEVKQCTVELTVPAGTSYRDLALKVLSSEVIKVQNSQRSKFDRVVNGQVFKKKFQSPGVQVDPEQAMIAKLAAMTAAERKAYYDSLEKRLGDETDEVETDEVDEVDED